MMFDMRLGCFRSVVRCVLMVTVSQVGMMGCRLVFACLMVLGGFLVVACRMLVVLCCLVMMLCCCL